MGDALHESLVLCNVNHGFGISGDHAVVRHNHNQCAFGHATAKKAELPVNALVRADPFVGIPTVIVPDLIGVPQIQICQTGRFCRLRRGCNPFSRIIVGNVVAAP